MSDIKMIVTMCAIENVPVELSKSYRKIKRRHGKRAADKLTYEYEFPGDAQCTTISSTPSQISSGTG